MKKVTTGLFILGLFSSVTIADTSEPDSASKTYLGLDLYQGESNFDVSGRGFNADKDFDIDGFRLKFGKSSPENIRYQVYFKSEDADEFFEDNIYGIGLDVMKAIPVGGERLNVFGLVGAGLDWTELEDDALSDYNDDSLNAFHLKLGFGGSYQINKSLEVITGFDLQFRSWQEIELIYIDNNRIYSDDLEIQDTSTTFYAGLNFYF